MVRRFRLNKGLGPRKSAVVEGMHILSEELDTVESDLTTVFTGMADKVLVKCTQTGKRLLLDIKLDGEPSKTMPILRDLHQAIIGYFNLKS